MTTEEKEQIISIVANRDIEEAKRLISKLILAKDFKIVNILFDYINLEKKIDSLIENKAEESGQFEGVEEADFCNFEYLADVYIPKCKHPFNPEECTCKPPKITNIKIYIKFE